MYTYLGFPFNKYSLYELEQMKGDALLEFAANDPDVEVHKVDHPNDFLWFINHEQVDTENLFWLAVKN